MEPRIPSTEVQHLTPRLPEYLANFLIGEGKLELYLEEFPPIDVNINKARTGLAEAKRYLLTSASEQGKKIGVLLDANLLLGKLHYAMGLYEDSLNYYNQAELQTLTEKTLPSRSLRIVAESYAIKGSSSHRIVPTISRRTLRIAAESLGLKGAVINAVDYVCCLLCLLISAVRRSVLGLSVSSVFYICMCLEKVPPSSSSKYKQAEWEEQRVQCFELAGDLTLLYLQEQDKIQQTTYTNTGSYSPQPPHPERQIGPVLETALQRAPILYIQGGKLQSAVARYRTMLSAVESSATQSLRLTLTRQLAEVLLRGVSGTLYTAPDSIVETAAGLLFAPLHLMVSLDSCHDFQRVGLVTTSKKSFQVSKTDSPWKPRKYTGLNLFVPRNENEEIILLLLISEAMAARDAVLSQSPEFKEARMHAYDNATAIYDLMAIALVRWGHVELLHEPGQTSSCQERKEACPVLEPTNTTFENSLGDYSGLFQSGGQSRTRDVMSSLSFERAMKFSFEEPHVWTQYGLCLVSMGHYVQALSVLKEVARLTPTKVTPCLLAARICYEHLNMLSEGVEWSKKALARDTALQQGLQSRSHLHIGIGYHLQSLNMHLKQEKQQLTANALDSFHKAQQTDPNDHLAEYYLALQYACIYQITEAVTHVKMALNLRSEHVPSLHLLVLLLSAHKQHGEALQLVEAAIEEYPDNLNLLNVKAHLELQSQGGEIALLTAKHMLALWKSLYENQTISDLQDQSDKRSDTRSVFQLYTSEMSDKDSSSLHAHSLAASRVEHTMSEVASSMSSFTPRPGPQRAWLLQLQIWLLLAEIYLSLEQLSAATACLQESTSIFPMSHNIMFMRGLIHEFKHEYLDAKFCFQNAVAINPTHIKSLQHLGLIHHYLGSNRLAEKTLRDAAKIDPSSHQTWYNLGRVLESLGEFDSASDSMATALEVETSNPILPFNSIPLTFD
uniref:Tetratricopeptide repeat protein 7 N-terminal domain-containing protein n=1 Tax=Timema genevievae TaxID=629358 RepID=A0A7R9JPT9_TIMGE|nr:unnamed protein product [Timema genevievae]